MLLFQKENEGNIALKRPRTSPHQLRMARCIATTHGTTGSIDSVK